MDRTVFFSTFLIFILAIVVFMIACMWKIYTKAGKPGWASIIPIYNCIVLLEIVKKPWWWIFLLILPFINIIFAIWVLNLLSKSFGKTEAFTIGLLLLGIVFYPILAFGSAQYQWGDRTVGASPNVLDSPMN